MKASAKRKPSVDSRSQILETRYGVEKAKSANQESKSTHAAPVLCLGDHTLLVGRDRLVVLPGPVATSPFGAAAALYHRSGRRSTAASPQDLLGHLPEEKQD